MPIHSAASHRPRRRHVGAAAVAVALAAGLALGPEAAAAPGVAELPDLVADRAEGLITTREVLDGRPGTRLLLRFDGHVHNAGSGRFEMYARAPMGSWEDGTLHMSDVRQRLYDAEGGLVREEPSAVRFMHAGPGAPARHQHWHTDRAAAYHLVASPSRAHVKESDKVGFCLSDSQPIEAPEGSPPHYNAGGCHGFDAGGAWIADPALTPGADHVVMGISAGFRDTYLARYWTQWVDLTGEVAPGRYQVMSVADPTNVILEADEANAPEFSGELRLRGWLALPQTAPAGPAGAPQRIALTAEKVTGAGLSSNDALAGEPAAPEHAIASPPAHGTLTLTGATAVYTPDPGYIGPDRFAFTAAEPGTMLARPPATVALTVSGPAAAAPAATAPTAAAPRGAAPRRRALAGTLRLRGRVATARVRARGMGKVAIDLRHRGRLVRRCVVRVRWGGRATCRATLPRGASARRLTAAAVQVRAGRVVARGRIAPPPAPQGRSANR